MKKVLQPFKIMGKYEFYIKTSSRGTETKYIKAISDLSISHKMLGKYKLNKGKIFLIIDKNLSPLRIANRGYPLRSIPNRDETWKEFLKKLV
ncbi:MAG: hypothetical protein COY38_00745 [Candidatus Aenigmarchaeota archaeon CG_4_10_14_0_8_um_filter_37_24]|nr:hypothetical protein [Candidatus Aenigmarchaeota archaeon]OIN86215.1 MAG: hypothetical protein AUJ50_04030 [Candidatus Aenigmarchaeota archaeon CG1_02_38_14]PIV69056.1 MAG: hypothetical protein COS07_02010 [Candidatus Aenigmarchaeota archaeon CG01_land_8_20_14_3_00_37_9]PIW41338.1 MAG: hypothetical protein COW21_02410 [Candidatus Aenigmarchaeota archaeon CG15_BIG_FIL_POST_REV_8_21_14_020_37_27]PIX50690.1 MAG: hypothetical protein COZ52_02785 [Candidatus Aenigmarchaeota archaeon CG_4_8_14_3_u